jgi:DNA-binding response OmpR family regulator
MQGERIVCSIQQRFQPSEAAILAISAIDYSRPSILVVDDDAQERHYLTGLLRCQQYQVVTAADGQLGYQQALARRPNLILLDVCMPGLDGFAACRLLKANPATAPVPVIFLSALDDPDERVAGLVLGGADYMSKPYHPPEVFARVRIHLGLARGAGEARQGAPEASACAKGMHPEEVLVNASKHLIDSNLAASLTLAQIAKAVGTYEKRLSAAFRQYAGMTVFAYLGEQRIARGLQLLAETDMSVHEIAAQTGFNNAGNFATAFRSRTGVTPTSYRQALRADARAASR